MSDTPKTDELAKRDFVPDGLWIRHARKLERENAALRADKERLDWLHYTADGIKWQTWNTNLITRDAIDLARKEAQP